MQVSRNEETSDEAANLHAMLSGFPNTKHIVSTLTSLWPEHVAYCKSRFRAQDDEFERRMDDIASLILKDVGAELPNYCRDYRWMCEEFLKEEIHFRRNGSYRLSSFEEAFQEVYNVPSYMGRYVRGILISQIVWEPHARAIDFFRTAFLNALPSGGDYLEVGPGHGLFLYFACQSGKLGRIEAWDVSQSSIAETHSALARLGATREPIIVEQDVLKAPSRHDEFDGAVISEVLEHLERPDLALRSLRAALKPGGRIFINAPVNSPAPDHIYLWSSIPECHKFIEDQGFEIETTQNFPMTGASLDAAVRKNLHISCVVIARKPMN